MESLLENKREYITHLCDITAERFVHELQKLYEGGKAPLEKFQTALATIPKWNNDVVHELRNTLTGKCEYLDELVKAIFTVCTQVHLIQLGKTKDKIKIRVPTTDVFLHHCLIEFARTIWKKPYLFYHEVRSLEKQRNLEICEKLARKAIQTTIRNKLPMNEIVSRISKAGIREDIESEVEDTETETESETEETETESDSESETQEATTEKRADTPGADKDESEAEENGIEEEEEQQEEKVIHEEKEQEKRENKLYDGADEQDGNISPWQSDEPHEPSNEEKDTYEKESSSRSTDIESLVEEEPEESYDGVGVNANNIEQNLNTLNMNPIEQIQAPPSKSGIRQIHISSTKRSKLARDAFF